jgi:tRNA G18 (ribose-2'-O)-methylase SpoU
MSTGLNLHRVQALDLTELEPYRTLRERTWHWGSGHFVAESEKVVRAVLDSGFEIRSMLLTEEWFADNVSVIDCDRLGNAPVFVASAELVQRIVGFSLHQGVMAVCGVPENPGLDELYHTADDTALLVALEGIADAENMGMILRNCAAFGVYGVLVGRDSCSPWHRRSVRVSVGHMFRLRIRICDHLLKDVQRLRSSGGVQLIGAVPRGGSDRISRKKDAEQRNCAPLCMLFGSEAHGLSAEAIALCDALFTIPMRHGVDSINVANASAVALYAASIASEHSGKAT